MNLITIDIIMYEIIEDIRLSGTGSAAGEGGEEITRLVYSTVVTLSVSSSPGLLS